MPTRRVFLTAATVSLAVSRQTIADARKGLHPGQESPMTAYKIPRTDLVVSRLAYGCAGLVSWDKSPTNADAVAKAMRVINTAYDYGINFFDHANLYAFGKAEATFGEVLKRSPGLRNKIIIQSKCGQYFPEGSTLGDPVRVDLGREQIVRSAEDSLKRLGTEHLDILLLHLPDALMEPERVAQAFDDLHRSGKVRYFGVSNHRPDQMALLQHYVHQPLVANQVHLGLGHCELIADGLDFTLEMTKGTKDAHHRVEIAGSGTLDYCRLYGIQVQAWSPLRGDLLNPPVDANPELKYLAQLLADVAKERNSNPSAIALAWLLRHPVCMVPIIGSASPEHVIENCAAQSIKLTREEWYALFAAATDVRSRELS